MNVRSLSAAVMILLGGCTKFSLFGDCSNLQKSESVSPGHRFRATVVERNCGATTSFATIVKLADEKTGQRSGDEEVVLSVGGQIPIKLTWKGDRELTITHSAADVFKNERRWKEVDVIHNRVVKTSATEE